MFHDREDAGRQLAAQLKDRAFRRPLVLAIPRGGVAVGAVLAEELGAELDVVLSRKLRASMRPELAIGAISEGGEVYYSYAKEALGIDERYLKEEQRYQLAEIARRAKLFREVRPRAQISGRSIIVTDDGIATGSTMIAALQLLRAHSPHELLVAVPVASPDRLAAAERVCDEVMCLLVPEFFYAIGQFYEDFRQIEDEDVVTILRQHSTEIEPRREVAQAPH